MTTAVQEYELVKLDLTLDEEIDAEKITAPDHTRRNFVVGGVVLCATTIAGLFYSTLSIF